MKPERLVIRNIGPFRGAHAVDFSALGDMFLVFGKTGSGKTTLFDALSYAFYGEVPGGRNGIERQMRSQYADDGDVSSVELTFTAGGKRYRVSRTLPYEKIGVRSGKTVQVQEESTLDQWVSDTDSAGAWESRTSTNKSETDRAILDVIKLSADEFSRIVILPQGEFARFLRLSTSERKDVLAKLFPVGRYTRVVELARERAKMADAREKETVDAIERLRDDFDPLAWETDRAAIEATLSGHRARQKELQGETSALSALLERSASMRDKAERARKTGALLASLREGGNRRIAQKKELSQARQAAPLAEELSSLENARERKTEAENRRRAVAGELAENAAIREEIGRERPRVAAGAGRKESLVLRTDRLRQAVRVAGEMETLEGKISQARAESTAEKKRIADLAAETLQAREQIAAAKPLLAAFDDLSQSYETARKALDEARRVKELSIDYEREARAVLAHRAAVEAAEAKIAENRKDYAIATAELEDLTARMEADREASLAATLAATLADGRPCPVCGALTHPEPAKARAAEAFPLADRIAAAKRRRETLEDECQKLMAERSARKANLSSAEEAKELIERKSGRSGPLPSPTEATNELARATQKTQAASDELARARKASRETAENQAKIDKLELERSSVQERLSLAERSLAESETSMAHAKKRFQEAFADGEPTADPSDELERCTAEIIEIDAAMAAWEEKNRTAESTRASLAGKAETIDRAIAEATAETEGRERAFLTHLAQAGFANERAVKAAIRTSEEAERIEADLAAYERELAEAETREKELTAELAAWSGPEPETIEADIRAKREALSDAGNAVEETSSALARLDALKARWDELEATRAARSVEAGKLRALANDLTGANPIKTSFDSWILGLYLEEITAYANERLVRMSEGRYRIQLNESYRKRNGLAGLDLEIFDAHTGKTRPTGTLSGGETFMASISLALGLADSIQSRSGGIQLDAVFIDEGFGSLDESSLERAITILDEIRGTRAVGIISHVGELRNRIPSKIEIIKTGAGSTIRTEA